MYDRFDNVTVLHHALLVDNTRPVVTVTVGSGEPPFNVSATATDASALVRADFKVDGIVFATRTTGSPYPTRRCTRRRTRWPTTSMWR